jgi:hypothetical protein
MDPECPFCHTVIDDELYSEYVGDYLKEFEFICPNCKAELNIIVDYIPTFLVFKKEQTQVEIA